MITEAAALAVILAVAVLWMFNRLIKLRNRVRAAWADLDVQLARRRDLLPNLVTLVKTYAAHERGLLEGVAAARQIVRPSQSPADRSEAEVALARAAARLVTVAEANPTLQADARFRELADELTAMENKIAFSRQLYNDTVAAYRTAVQSFPGALLAAPLGFDPPAFFEAEPWVRGAIRQTEAGDGRAFEG